MKLELKPILSLKNMSVLKALQIVKKNPNRKLTWQLNGVQKMENEKKGMYKENDKNQTQGNK